tara:strand:+ start:830 stop:1150 length:321 start_codon:yes stop_codon:yes gene_type:complete
MNKETPEKQDVIRLDNGQYAKGQSGNPNGRPKKGLAIADILTEIGERFVGKDKTLKEEVLEKAYDMALAGDLNAIKFIAERLEGSSVQRMQVENDKPIEVLRIVDE